MPRAKPMQLDRFLPYRLSVLSNTVSSAIAGAYARRFGLTIPEWRVIAVLAATPDLSAAEVAARTAMDKVAVSRAVTSLARARRIARRVSRSDRRRSLLRLTGAGERVYREVVPFALAYERELLRPLDARSRAALDRTLATLLGRARKMGPVHTDQG